MSRAVLNKSLVQFSVGGCGCVPSLLFNLRPNYGGGNEYNGDLLQKVPCTLCAPNPAAGHHRPIPLPETPGHSQASLDQSLVGSLLLSPGFLCTQGFVCALQESVSPVLWKFCNQIPLAFKVIFPGYFQFLYLIPRLGNLLWALEFSQQCENFFGIIVLQFVGPLLSGSMVELMATSFKRAYGTDSASRSAAARAPVPAAGHC